MAFYSARLQKGQQLWPPYDRELLAAWKGIRHFKEMLEGRAFTLYTDHESLVPSIEKKSDPQTARQQYQLAGIAEYTTDIRYIQGKSNVVADALSRPPQETTPEISLISNSTTISACQSNASATTTAIPFCQNAASSRDNAASKRQTKEQDASNVMSPTDSASTPSAAASNSTPTPSSTSFSSCFKPEAASDFQQFVNSIGNMQIDFRQMARDQPMDPEFARLMQDARTSLHFRTVDMEGFQLIVDTSNGPARPWVPLSWRRRVFNTIHGLGHPGVHMTQKAVAAKFVWPRMRQDVAKWARDCLSCQRAKVTRHVVPPIGEFAIPNRRFEHVNVDLVSMPPSNGHRYLFTVVDRLSRWPAAIPIRDITTESVTEAFAHGWIANYGVPASVTTDRGTQFTSSIWTQLMTTWGIKHHTTTP